MKKKTNQIRKIPQKTGETDLTFFLDEKSSDLFGGDRITFDGYKLTWHGENSNLFEAFSGPAEGNSKESEKDKGTTPQGKYTISPSVIQEFEPNNDWGSYRVPLEPYRFTVDRMINCFGFVRTQMYIHGGNKPGTIGCIEINNDQEEIFFLKN